MSGPTKQVFQIHHDTNPIDDIRKAVGDISKIRLGQGKVLLGLYKRPEKIGSIIRPGSTQEEDVYQGKAWLVLAHGPLCFQDSDQGSFGGFDAMVDDWVLARNNDGYRVDIGSEGSSGHQCLIIQDRYIKAVLPAPYMVW